MHFRFRAISATALCATLLGLQPSASEAQSFDCAKAGNPTEHQICATPDLGDLDTGLAVAYRLAREGLSGAARDKVSANQRAWISQRNACGDDFSCIQDSYVTRMEQLTTAYDTFSGWAGSYYSNAAGIEITIVEGQNGDYSVLFQGGQENYTCGPLQGVGTADSKDMVVTSGQNPIMEINALGDGIYLPSGETNAGIRNSCGMLAPDFQETFFPRE